MKLRRSCAPPARRAGFTLVEIMIVVVLIGLLCMMAIPALNRVREKSQRTRFISDLRTFSQAFETYNMQNGVWPPNAGTGVLPTGMTAQDIKVAAWTTQKNSLGGRWNWDQNNFGAIAAISTTNVTASDATMLKIDRQIDDGDLTSGMFQKNGTRFVYMLLAQP
jgi:prepilin-type N-terminal cleavage/methylation domain-containing protein